MTNPEMRRILALPTTQSGEGHWADLANRWAEALRKPGAEATLYPVQGAALQEVHDNIVAWLTEPRPLDQAGE
mgnify:CR=1 FL=1